MHEYHAALLKVLDHMLVVHDLMKHVERRAMFLKRALNGFDRHFHARTKAARLGEYDFFHGHIKRSHFAGGDLPPPLFKYCKGDARPLWKPDNIVPASRGGVNIEFK